MYRIVVRMKSNRNGLLIWQRIFLKASLIKEISDKKAKEGLRIIEFNNPRTVKTTRRLMKDEQKGTAIVINICRRLQTSRDFFLPNHSEISPANVRPNTQEGWFRLTGKKTILNEDSIFFLFLNPPIHETWRKSRTKPVELDCWNLGRATVR